MMKQAGLLFLLIVALAFASCGSDEPRYADPEAHERVTMDRPLTPRRSIGNHAPSMFVDILENKVKSLGGRFERVKTQNAASRFDFTDGSLTEHDRSERAITLSNGDTHQRDMLAAFNLQHLKLDETKTKQYDTEAMAADYDRFCQLEHEEILRYKNKEKKDDRGTIGAGKL